MEKRRVNPKTSSKYEIFPIFGGGGWGWSPFGNTRSLVDKGRSDADAALRERKMIIIIINVIRNTMANDDRPDNTLFSCRDKKKNRIKV